jgi:hypothetical protein
MSYPEASHARFSIIIIIIIIIVIIIVIIIIITINITCDTSLPLRPEPDLILPSLVRLRHLLSSQASSLGLGTARNPYRLLHLYATCRKREGVRGIRKQQGIQPSILPSFHASSPPSHLDSITSDPSCENYAIPSKDKMVRDVSKIRPLPA